MGKTSRLPLVCSVTASVFFGFQTYAQTSVPTQYQPLYNELQASMQAVETGLAAGAPGATNFTFSGQSLTTNAEIGLGLLKPGARSNYLRELQALKALGLTGINVSAGFPILYQPFYASQGLSADYEPMLAFYQQLVRDAHSMGLKVSMETESLFPGYYSSAAGFNVGPYFQSLTLQELEQGRAAQAATIYASVQPDYLDLGSEPDTEAANTGQTAFLNPATWAQAISSYVQAIPSGNHNPPLGAGVGNWRVNDGITFVQDETAIPGLDYIDLHAYPVVNIGSINTFQYLLQLINAAKAANKPVAMSEFWLLKVSSQTLTTSNAQDPNTASLNAYSFFEPLDEEFLTDMWKLGNQNDFLYGSAFWTRYFWAYVPFSSAPAPGAALDQTAAATASVAIVKGQKDGTAAQVQSLTGAVTPSLVVASSADYTTLVAVGSLASLFGTNLASGSATATSLGTNLDNVTVSVKDSTGNTQPADVLYVSPGQVNFVVPAGLATGPATLTTSSGSGNVQTVNFNLYQTAPGIFTANGSGSGVAAAESLVVGANGAPTYTDIFGPCSSSVCQAVPINVSGGNVYLILYGTGISGAGQSAVTATINGQTVPVSFAGRQGGFAGIDQVNIPIPASFAGVGTVNVQVAVSGFVSNTVQIDIQ